MRSVHRWRHVEVNSRGPQQWCWSPSGEKDWNRSILGLQKNSNRICKSPIVAASELNLWDALTEVSVDFGAPLRCNHCVIRGGERFVARLSPERLSPRRRVCHPRGWTWNWGDAILPGQRLAKSQPPCNVKCLAF
eukprot:s1518_g18.t1